MAESSKRRVSVKIASKDKPKITNAISVVETHLGLIAPVWAQLTDEQRRQVLEHSPLLSRVLQAVAPFRMVL